VAAAGPGRAPGGFRLRGSSGRAADSVRFPNPGFRDGAPRDCAKPPFPFALPHCRAGGRTIAGTDTAGSDGRGSRGAAVSPDGGF
jgi:hypothetical protein